MAQVSYGTITITDTTDIDSIVVEYARNQSTFSAPDSQTGGWSTTRPTWAQGYYIWQRTRIHKSGTDSSEDEFGTAVCITGSTGQTGAAGRSLTATETKYTNVASGTTQAQVEALAESAWVSNVPSYNSSKPDYWIRVKNTYDKTPTTKYIYYKDNATGESLYNSAIANSISQSANENANGALSIATGVEQHFFWIGEDYSTSVPAGAYMAERGKDEFKANPTGGNLITRTDGIYIRNGANLLSSLTGSALNFYQPPTTNGNTVTQGKKTMMLSANALRFYDPSDGTTEQAKLDTNGLVLSKGGIKAGTSRTNDFIYLSSANFADTISGHNAGTVSLDNYTATDWRQLIGTKFGVRADGTLYASNAEISGKITVGSGSNVYTIDEADNAFDELGAAYQAQTNAISAAAADATDKANVAQAAAELAAATDATNKADKAATTASNYIDDLGEGGTYIYSSNTQSKIQLSQNGIFLYNGNNIVAQYTNNIVLGELDNIHIELSALEGLGFYQGRGLDNRVAYINQNKLFIEAAEIKNELRIGPFIWKVRDADTRISLRYEPRQEVNNG